MKKGDKMYDVISVGSATLDAFAHTTKEFVKKREYHFPIGSKILIHKIDFDTGGGGTNTAVCFSRLGLKTAFVGKLSCCDNSERILKQLKKEKIDTSLAVKSKKGKAGFSIILDADKTDRTILAYKGLNEDFKFNELNKKKLKKTRWIYLTSFTGRSFKESKKLAKFAKDNKINLAFNPSSYIAKKGYKHLKKIIDCVDVLILNKEEAGYLVKGKKIDELAKKLWALGPRIVVVTDGKKGAWAFDGIDIFHSKPHKVKIVETTGAGDAFASTFIGALIKGRNIEDSMKIAQINSESIIKHMGAKNLLLTWKELLKQIKK